jgi:hypothetical protein
MSEERRYAARHRLQLPVYIRYGRRPFLGACARDLSVGGMFLSVQSLTLPAGTPIELELSCLGRDWLIPAIVVHGDNTGIGVMFREPQAELFRGLMQATNTLPPVSATAGAAADSRP